VPDINDIVLGTLDNYDKNKMTENVATLQKYAVGQLLLDAKRTTVTGKDKKIHVLFDDGRVAQHVGLYHVDNPAVQDAMQELTVPWVHMKHDWSYDQTELAIQGGPEKIQSVVKSRQAQVDVQNVAELETRVWSLRTSAQTLLPYGIPYWIVLNASAGFNGGRPSGYTDVGGIDPDTYSQWQNYTATFTNISREGALTALRTAHLKTEWRSPTTLNQYSSGKASRVLFMKDDVMLEFEILAENQNENLGNDVASKTASTNLSGLSGMGGFVTFRRHPIVNVPELNNNEPQPNTIYMIDLDTMKIEVLRDFFWKREGPIRSANQSLVWTTHSHLTYRLYFVDRRKNAGLYQAA
jgi:hypothetical protein